MGSKREPKHRSARDRSMKLLNKSRPIRLKEFRKIQKGKGIQNTTDKNKATVIELRRSDSHLAIVGWSRRTKGTRPANLSGKVPSSLYCSFWCSRIFQLDIARSVKARRGLQQRIITNWGRPFGPVPAVSSAAAARNNSVLSSKSWRSLPDAPRGGLPIDAWTPQIQPLIEGVRWVFRELIRVLLYMIKSLTAHIYKSDTELRYSPPPAIGIGRMAGEPGFWLIWIKEKYYE